MGVGIGGNGGKKSPDKKLTFCRPVKNIQVSGNFIYDINLSQMII